MTASVCIATYNGEKYIKRQLDSIIEQLSEHDEIIISDDKSSDSTLEIIHALNDRRIKIHENRCDKGPSGNFQNAMQKATKDIIVLADQDDIWLPDKLNLMRPLMINYDLVITDCEIIDMNGVTIHSSFFDIRGSKAGFWNNFYKNSYMGCCMGFRRSLLNKVLPIPKSVHMHDWWIGLIAERVGKVYFLPIPLIQYVRHGENASPTGETGYNIIRKAINRFFLLYHYIRRVF